MLAAAVPDIEAFVASEAGKQLCAGFNQSVPDTVAQVSQSWELRIGRQDGWVLLSPFSRL